MLEGKRIAILAEQDFEDAELTEPLQAMKAAGARVTVVGSGTQKSYKGKRGAAEIKVDADADQVGADDFDAVIIPGGYAPDKMRLHKAMVDLVRKMHDSGKVVAAICHGPQLLISAEIVRGRRVTSWPSVAIDLKNAGAVWVDEPVVRDENLITSRQPADIPEFNAAIVQTLRNQMTGSLKPIELARRGRMSYSAKDYGHLIGMKGFSETLLRNHFTLYQGYVANTNKLMDILSRMLVEGNINTPESSELKRRVGFEFNGMRLHEYYFENLRGKAPPGEATALVKTLSDAFGSYEAWLKDFKATGAMRGIGWAILCQDTSTGNLFNQWINEHETGHLAGGRPLLVMDVFEHAYMTDYGLKRADYVEAFLDNVNWDAVRARLNRRHGEAER
jgi:superoxide dismutase, Fe-Mn family